METASQSRAKRLIDWGRSPFALSIFVSFLARRFGPSAGNRQERKLLESKMPILASQWKPVQTNDIREQPLLSSGKPALLPKVLRATWLGLFLSLFVMLLVRQSVSYFWPTLTFTAAIWTETLLSVSAITLLFIIRRGERLPLTSIGLGTSRWWKSILWGLRYHRRLRNRRRRTGCAHRVRPRPRLGCI